MITPYARIENCAARLLRHEIITPLRYIDKSGRDHLQPIEESQDFRASPGGAWRCGALVQLFHPGGHVRGRVVPGDVRDGQVAARGHGPLQLVHDLMRMLTVWNEMQNSDEKNGDRLSKVNKRQKLGIVQYLLGPGADPGR